MQRSDLADFEKLMGVVAENFGHKVLSAEALRIWITALEEHPFMRVRSVLLNWMQQKTKFPLIADLTRACSDIAALERDRIAAVERERFNRMPEYHGPSEAGQRAIKEIRALLKQGMRPPGRWWATEILDAHAEGLPVPEIAVRFAREVAA